MRDSILITIGVCCIYPLVIHFGLLALGRFLRRHDWKNIDWSRFPTPWRQDQ